MKFSFYGDSWFWTWNHKGLFPRRSEELKKLFYQEYADALPLIDILLSRLGHATINHCSPATNFTQTAQTFCDTVTDADYNVVFYSFDLRSIEASELILTFNCVHQLQESLDNLTLTNLKKIRDHSEAVKQHTIIVGGQGTIMPGVFEQVPQSEYFHLLSPCMLNSIWFPQLPVVRFKLVDFCDSEDPNLELYNPEVLNAIYDDLDTWRNRITEYTPIDGGHLDGNSTVEFLNRLFLLVEHINNTL